MFVQSKRNLTLFRFHRHVAEQEYGLARRFGRELNEFRPRRVVSSLVTTGLILAAVLGLSACGGSNSSTTSSAPPAVGSTATTASIQAPPASNDPPRHARVTGSPTPGSSKGDLSFRVSSGDNTVPDFGQEAHPSQRQLAAAALAAFMRARANGEWSKVCDYVARADRRLPEGIAKHSQGKIAGCGAALKALMTGHNSEYADTLIRGVAALRIKGKTAFALFYGPHAQKYVMPMQEEGSTWKMTQLAPLPYPLDAPAGGAP